MALLSPPSASPPSAQPRARAAPAPESARPRGCVQSPRARLGPFALSLVLHGVALGAALFWFSEASPKEARPVLQAASMAFVEPEDAADVSELELLPEALPSDVEVELPLDLLPPDEPEEADALPAFDATPPEHVPLTLPDVPLHAVGTRPRPVASVLAPPPTPPAPAVQPPLPRAQPAPRPARRPPARPAAARAPGQALKLVYRPNVMNYYPAAARSRGIEGQVLVEIRVDARGVVVEAHVFTSSGSALLDRQAVRLMYDYRFAPGAGGRARVPVSFRLR